MPDAIYRNLLFDFGQVIIDIDIPGAMDRLMRLLKADGDRDRIQRILLDYECGKVSTDILINSVISQSQPNVQALDVIEAWNSMLIGIPHYRLDMLKKLRESYSVYLLSNTNALHIEWVHRYMHRTFGTRDFEKEYFDTVYYSHLIGHRKPSPEIFQYVMDDVFLEPAATLFLDDNVDNINAAQAMGFGTHLVLPGEEIAEFLKVNGFY